MKDYSSLETKIRKLVEGRLQPGGWEQVTETLWVHPVAEIARVIDTQGNEVYINKDGNRVDFFEGKEADGKKADADRRSVVNVGRPDTATSPTDPKAKLAKQAEIKTKIIDENRNNDRYVMLAKNVLDLLPIIRLMEKKDDKEKDKKKPDDKTKNPVVNGTSKHEPGDPKVIDRKEGPKKENGAVDDDKDPKKITGGKTQVDVHPKTDDSINDDSKETADAKKAKAEANKKIGAKGGKAVKEETIDELSHETLGNYIKKAAESKTEAGKEMANSSKNKIAIRSRGLKTDIKRTKGISTALDKITKEEFTAEELAHFDAVMAEEYVDMSKKNVDAIINAKGKPHKVYTATDETRHGIAVDELKRHLGVGDSDHVNKRFMHNLHTAGVRTGWSHSVGKWIAYQGPKI